MPSVKIYSTPWCSFCKMAKKYFDENRVKYQEFDVAGDEGARDEMIKKTGQLGVPVIEVDGKIVIGFDREHLAELLGIKV